MDPKTASLLADPEPGSHLVFPCPDEDRIIEAVAHYAASGLNKGDAVILIVTEPHREAIILRLKAETFNVERLQSDGQLVFFDADALLITVMSDGAPNPLRFAEAIRRSIERARKDLANGQHRQVRLFGEMVSLLWSAGNAGAAMRLEELWNSVVEEYSTPLLCTYTLNVNGHSKLPDDIVAAHSHDLSLVDHNCVHRMPVAG